MGAAREWTVWMNLAQYIASTAENTHLGNTQSCKNWVIVSPFAISTKKVDRMKPSYLPIFDFLDRKIIYY